jgi:hypothetical protein
MSKTTKPRKNRQTRPPAIKDYRGFVVLPGQAERFRESHVLNVSPYGAIQATSPVRVARERVSQAIAAVQAAREHIRVGRRRVSHSSDGINALKSLISLYKVEHRLSQIPDSD